MRRDEGDVATGGESDAIRSVGAEEIILAFGKAIGFGAIDWNPGFAWDEKESPAVIATERFLFVFFVRKVEADFEAAGYAGGATEGVEEGMKIGAVAFTCFASVTGAAEAPALVIFVVGHLTENVIVNGAGFLESGGFIFGDCGGYFSDLVVDEDELVRGEKRGELRGRSIAIRRKF